MTQSTEVQNPTSSNSHPEQKEVKAHDTTRHTDLDKMKIAILNQVNAAFLRYESKIPQTEEEQEEQYMGRGKDPRLKPHLTVQDLQASIERWFDDFSTNMSMFGDVILKDYDECVQDFVKKTIELHCEDLGECIDVSIGLKM